MVVCSDSENFVSCVLAPGADRGMAGDAEQWKHSFVRLVAWELQEEKQGHLLVVVSDLQFLGRHTELIGEPVAAQRPTAQSAQSPVGMSIGCGQRGPLPQLGQQTGPGQPPQQPSADADYDSFLHTQPGNPSSMAGAGGAPSAAAGAGSLQGPMPGGQPGFSHQQHQQLQQAPQPQQWQHQQPPQQQVQQQQLHQPLHQPMQTHQQQQPMQHAPQLHQEQHGHQHMPQQHQQFHPTAPSHQYQQQQQQPNRQQQQPWFHQPSQPHQQNSQSYQQFPLQQQQQPPRHPQHPPQQPQHAQRQQMLQRQPSWGQDPTGARGLGSPAPHSRAGAGAAGGASQAGSDACVDISALTPYQGKRWRIKGRIINKSDVRKFNGARGPGQLFKIDLIDRSNHEVSATFFGQAVDDFYDRLQTHKVYYFAGGLVKAGNPKYDKNPCQITFDAGTLIDDAGEDSSIPGLTYNFQTIAQIQAQQGDEAVDLKGIVSEVRPIATIKVRATGEERSKRDLLIWDNSGQDRSSHIALTVWGDRALAEYPADVPIFVKSARLREWNGMKSLTGGNSTNVSFEMPGNTTAAQELVQLWSSSGQPAAPQSLRGGAGEGKRATIEELHGENSNLGPAPEPGQPLRSDGPSSVHRHTVVGTITTVLTERPPYYPACSHQVDDGRGKTRSCNKKLTDEGGIWHCMSGHSCEQPCYRYLFRARVTDHSGMLEVNSFDEGGKKLFGCDANELAELWDVEERSEELQQKLKRPYWQRCVLNVRSMREVWQDEERVKVAVNDVKDEEPVKEARRKLSEIHATFNPVEGMVGSPKNGGA